MNMYTISLAFAPKGGQRIETHKLFETTKEENTMLKELKGDEAAQVRINLEIADKNFGRGVSVSGSISLTVGQDDALLDTAFNYGAAILAEKIKEIAPKLNRIYEDIQRERESK